MTAFGLLALLVGGIFGILLLTLADQRDAWTLARSSRAQVTVADRLLQLASLLDAANCWWPLVACPCEPLDFSCAGSVGMRPG
jgi:hypothetical protein